MTAEIKARKSNKEKLKTFLAVMNSMDEDELGEVGPTSRPMHVPSLHTNTSMVNHFPSTLSGSSINLSQSPSRLSIPLSPSSSGTDSTSDVLDLANSVLT